jgi:hypothetical protein
MGGPDVQLHLVSAAAPLSCLVNTIDQQTDACAVHASSFALHVKSWPFRHKEDSLLKAFTEAHLFIVLLFVLTMKTDLHGEALTAGHYGTRF